MNVIIFKGLLPLYYDDIPHSGGETQNHTYMFLH